MTEAVDVRGRRCQAGKCRRWARVELRLAGSGAGSRFYLCPKCAREIYLALRSALAAGEESEGQLQQKTGE